VGNRLTMSETSGTHNYGYDDIYRLLSAAHPSAAAEAYSYDKVGNRLTSAAEPSWNYDANNRLTSYDGVSFTYDNSGNTTAKQDGAALTAYTYDYENRLETADPGVPVSYGYDPFGKRLAKTVGGVTTYYLYDEEDVIAEYDAAGAVVATYIHGPGIDEPISMTRGGNTYFYTMDGLGSVRDLTDAAQSIVEQYDYDSFGNLTIPPTTGNPYTYTSREYDPETGLLFYRARYYDPKVGRFLTADPIGFEGGDINFYAYVANNPVNRTDPLGLHWVCDTIHGCYFHTACINGHEHANRDAVSQECHFNDEFPEIPEWVCEVGVHIGCHLLCESSGASPLVCVPACIAAAALTCSEECE
jgi:RHS repeat-associated protein